MTPILARLNTKVDSWNRILKTFLLYIVSESQRSWGEDDGCQRNQPEHQRDGADNRRGRHQLPVPEQMRILRSSKKLIDGQHGERTFAKRSPDPLLKHEYSTTTKCNLRQVRQSSTIQDPSKLLLLVWNVFVMKPLIQKVLTQCADNAHEEGTNHQSRYTPMNMPLC